MTTEPMKGGLGIALRVRYAICVTSAIDSGSKAEERAIERLYELLWMLGYDLDDENNLTPMGGDSDE